MFLLPPSNNLVTTVIVNRRVIEKNKARVSEVWMDEWKNILYHLQTADSTLAGDVRERVELRKQLKCHSFRWYLNNIYTHSQFPINHHFFGNVKNIATGMCLQVSGKPPKSKLIISTCRHTSSKQLFLQSAEYTLQNDNQCMAVDLVTSSLKLSACQLQQPRSKIWKYSHKTKSFLNIASSKCLSITSSLNENNKNNNSNKYNNNLDSLSSDKDLPLDYSLNVVPCVSGPTQAWRTLPLAWQPQLLNP